MRILVLGAYGLIGSHIVRSLLLSGHVVVGLGRDIARARRQWPQAEWIDCDLARLRTPGHWAPLLAEARPDAIVNCAGALQDGARDRVSDVQSGAIRALILACGTADIEQFVQISAGRADPDAETEFMRSKGEADRALAASPLEWTILRPGLVMSPQAYGGTALLRALASVPLVQPIAYGECAVQTVSADDVALAVVAVLERKVPSRNTYDLVETEPHSLSEIVGKLRRWLGFPPAPSLTVPSLIVSTVARVADALGWLGWRSPLRSTVIRELAAGVRGDPRPWNAAGGHRLTSLDQTLVRMPSTVQERWFSRSFLLKPLVLATLAAFWIASGAIGLLRADEAASVLTQRGTGERMANVLVLGGAVLDLALGLAILHRSTAARAAQGMIAVTLAYLAGGSLLAPDLWLDPMGPLVKPIPAMMLAIAALTVDGDR